MFITWSGDRLMMDQPNQLHFVPEVTVCNYPRQILQICPPTNGKGRRDVRVSAGFIRFFPTSHQQAEMGKITC